MAEREHPPPDPDAPPDERYQARPQAWLTQADALARLRDEVRTAAEREALDIVGGARRNIRQVITDARRDLLVLSAQLHATLGTPVLPHGPGSLPEALPALGSGEARHDAEATGPDAERNAAVRAALERAKADIDALAQELDGAELPLEPTRAAEPREPAAVDAPVHTPRSILEPEASVRGVPWRPSTGLTPDAHATLSRTPSRRLVAGLTFAAAILLMTGLVWLWPSGPSSPAGTPPDAVSGSALPPPAVEPESASAVPAAPPPAPASGVSVVFAAERPAWIRTTIDGQADLGRTYEAGETRQLQAARSVALRVGDAGAVTVSVDGSPPVVLGTDGAVIDREFIAADAAAPAARAAPPVAAPATPPAAEPASAAGTGPGAPTTSPAPQAAETSGLPPAPEPAPAVAPPATVAAPPPAADQAAAAQAEAEALEATSAWVPEVNIVTAGQEWLDAYHRQDARAMALVSNEQTTIADERQAGERFTLGLDGVQRQFDAVSVEFAGDTAVYTARMVERRAEPGAAPEEHVARVAQIWTRRGGRWQLSDVRIVSEARLGQLVR